MLDELNQLIESIMIDVASEGTGSAFGIIIMWGLFFGGTFAVFSALMSLLASMV